MCIVGLIQSPSARVPLVLVHNRDESLHRPTESMARRRGVLCGKDLQAGGTWLGFHESSGRLAAVTNVVLRGYPKGENTSRGSLVMDILNAKLVFPELRPSGVEAVPLPHDYAGFNIVTADLYRDRPLCHFVTNCVGAPAAALPQHGNMATVQCLAPGVHCFSNSTLDDTAWPKVSWLKGKLRGLAAEMGELQPAHGPMPLAQSLLAGWEQLEREEVEVADRIVAKLTPIMSSDAELPESGKPMEPVTPSLPQNLVDETTRMVFVRPQALDPPEPYGTRAQTVVVRTQHFVVLYSRDTALEEDPHRVQNHAWERFCVPIPHLHRAHHGKRYRICATALAVSAALAALAFVRQSCAHSVGAAE